MRRTFLIAAAVVVVAAGCKVVEEKEYQDILVPWLKDVSVAVCQLEVQNPTGLNPTKRICPSGEGGPGDKTPPPQIPPP